MRSDDEVHFVKHRLDASDSTVYRREVPLPFLRSGRARDGGGKRPVANRGRGAKRASPSLSWTTGQLTHLVLASTMTKRARPFRTRLRLLMTADLLRVDHHQCRTLLVHSWASQTLRPTGASLVVGGRERSL